MVAADIAANGRLELANQFSTNLKSSASRLIELPSRGLPCLSLIAFSLFLFVGTTYAQSGPCPAGHFPCILLSDGVAGQVTVWSDDGTTLLNPALLDGGGSGEGIACISGSANVLYVVSLFGISVYSMNLNSNGQAPFLNDLQVVLNGAVAGLAVNRTGTLLYAGEYNPGDILSFTPLPAFPWLMLNSAQTTTDSIAHDIALGAGNCAPNVSCSYVGNLVSTHFQKPNTGMFEYMPNLDRTQQLPFLGQFLPDIPPVNNSNCANFAGVTGQRCWTNLSGMAFDQYGNLWVNSTAANQNGTFEFAPGGTCGAQVCPLNFVPDITQPGGNPEPIGLTIASPGDINAGKILVANFSGQSVNIIDPSTCTGQNPSGSSWTLGSCTESSFITDTNRLPKYVLYNTGCPNPDNNGYLEICKQGNSQYPPPNQLYDFTVTAPLFSTGTVQVPLGGCSGSIQVPGGNPSAPVIITETPVSGVLVSDVTAYSYSQLGQYENQLQAWMEPDLSATVGVMAGDVSLETEAIFTNYSASPGQLKICKIAGQQNIVGQLFMFTVTAPGGYRQTYMIEAGPADQGGYCELADTFPANTPVTVTENLGQNSPYQVSGITVDCNACTYSFPTSSSVATTIGAGITETSFTNAATATMAQCPATGAVYSDGLVNGGLAAWPINSGTVISDTFTVPSGGSTISGLCFYAWLLSGDVLTQVEVSISTAADAGTFYFDQTETFTCQSFCAAGTPLNSPNRTCGDSLLLKQPPTGQYNVFACSTQFSGPGLSSGTYWLNLQNAIVPSGGVAYWDQNNGVGCPSPGCPSQASDSMTGNIKPEAFVLY